VEQRGITSTVIFILKLCIIWEQLEQTIKDLTGKLRLVLFCSIHGFIPVFLLHRA
jgi:hypothetical protein